MTACNAKLGFCFCERRVIHTAGASRQHRCHCGNVWHDGDAGVQFGTKPVQPAWTVENSDDPLLHVYDNGKRPS